MTPIFDFAVFPALSTERLLLREITPADAPAIFALRSDYAVTRYNFGAAYTAIDQAHRLIEAISAGYESGSEIRWAITLDDQLIGLCGYNYWNRRDYRAAIGYDLAQAQWGQGITTEALRAVIAFGFDHMRLNRIEADCTAENVASARVLEKLGFVPEGTQREQYFDEGRFWDLRLFALLRRDYQQQRPAL